MRKERSKRHGFMSKRRKEAIEEILAGIIGWIIFSIFIVALMFDPLPDSEAQEERGNIGKVEWCGEWFEPEEYSAMMEEREAYLAAERAAEMEFYEKLEQLNQLSLYGEEAPDAYISMIRSTDLDAEESYLLAKIAMAEMEGECVECKALVIYVVLNRVWSDEFPNTIEEVIREHHGNTYQFSTVGNGRFDKIEPDADCWEALKMVQDQYWDESKGALYFELTRNNPTWHSRNLQKLFEHCDTSFYKERD